MKTIDVLPGNRLSLQEPPAPQRALGYRRWPGAGDAGRRGVRPRGHESAYIPRGVVHRLENVGTGRLRVVEIAVGDELGEDDIIRYEDDWAR